ncbi:M48 family metallopeptidase [Gynuella sunshinyii]|uniref:Zn-dependent protease with chaperone function n=1 Tax=Gynuella sunshinyii YC6258 TaxID=1445510 RepID=A0A0C5VNX9_9GAMM|nr:M48 family metallopeptidase [Gynuella sunshinyii]AJQ95108.1 Zn-dependent protease with chaperone function [Gynuella sunshinyii YC6258]DAC80083.1 TPA_exp: hypothetical protein [Gynuella sunshinyii YC6258]
MTIPHLYPSSPKDIPNDLTRPSGSYRRQAWLAVLGLMVFMTAYIALALCFGTIAFTTLTYMSYRGFDFFHLIILVCSGLLTLFMVKSLFSVHKTADPQGIEITEQQQPDLFAFIHCLADEIGAPRPHRVFLTPEVNAAVFYDLSFKNLLFPSRKNLIIGMGLVNVLSLGEFKAVLAHEFGHFAQRSMLVGRWVYIAQQIIGHMINTRDWLDNLVRFVSRIDIRIAWVGWLLSLLLWSIRSLADSLFRLVVIAERALSREMEFNADLVAVSVSGSDALIHALHKLQAADHAWSSALNIMHSEAGNGKRLDDIFVTQHNIMTAMRNVLDDPDYGIPSAPDKQDEAARHRIFSQEMARPPQMWATHPANRDREDNAKNRYVSSTIDPRSAWELFQNPDALRADITTGFYQADKLSELEPVAGQEAVTKRFERQSLHPQYRGNYLNREAMRNFSSIEELLQAGTVSDNVADALGQLFPTSLKQQLAAARNLDTEIETFQALERGDLKPSGGVIRYRNKEINKAEIPQVLEQLAREREQIIQGLKHHDASCHRTYLKLAEQRGKAWHDHLRGLLELLHCCEHLAAVVRNEQNLLTNTWAVITADGQIGHFEKKRMLKVAGAIQTRMREVSDVMLALQLTDHALEDLGVENWHEQCPQLGLVDVDAKNWGEWCPAAHERMNIMAGILEYLRNLFLEDLVCAEQMLADSLEHPDALPTAPRAGKAPAQYPVLLPGQEHPLQYKLDLWNRFQLAHGLIPSLLRLTVTCAIIGGTLYFGWILI